MERYLALSDFGRLLFGRERGAEVAKVALREELSDLDFTDVETINAQFLNALFGPLPLEQLRLRGMNSDLRRTIGWFLVERESMYFDRSRRGWRRLVRLPT